MVEMNSEQLLKKEKALSSLLDSQQTLLLATASSDGAPQQSYAPFVREDNAIFYILISELSAHTGNLIDNPLASIMLIRPENESDNLYARERVIYQCTVSEIQRTDELYQQKIVALQEQFGNIVNLLSSLADFHLFALTPVSGRYVAGFGQAYTIDPLSGRLSPLIKKHG